MPVPWGDLYFLDAEHLLVPYAEIRRPTPRELAEERARRKQWLKRPTKEIVDELVQKTPGEPDNVYTFRRWMAERYVEYVKANPDAALKADQKYVRETGLRVFRMSGGVEEMRRIPVWRGRAGVQNTTTSLGGLGPQAVSWTTPMVNLQVGVVAGSRYVAAWSWPGLSGRPEDRGMPLAAVLLDRASLRILSPLKDMRPVIWVEPERLLVLHRQEGKWRPALLDIRTTPDGVAFHIVRRYAGPGFGRPASISTLSTPVLLPPAAGDKPRFLLFRHGRKAAWLDLVGDRWETLGQGVNLTPYGGIYLLGPRAWLASVPYWADAIRDAGGKVVIDRHEKLPYEPLVQWEGPVAVIRDGLVWGRDPGARRDLGHGARSSTSSNRLALYLFRPQRRTLSRLSLPIIPARPPVGNGHLVAVSPDGRWLAARVSVEEVRLRRLPSLITER